MHRGSTRAGEVARAASVEQARRATAPRRDPNTARRPAAEEADAGDRAERQEPSAAEALLSRLGEGRALTPDEQGELRPAFGSTAHLRVHSDAGAAEIADDRRVRAFSLGRHIGFARGEYRPGTLRTRAILAHEAARARAQDPSHEESSERPDPLAEADADRAAGRALLGHRGGSPRRGGLRLHGCGDFEMTRAQRDQARAWLDQRLQVRITPAPPGWGGDRRTGARVPPSPRRGVPRPPGKPPPRGRQPRPDIPPGSEPVVRSVGRRPRTPRAAARGDHLPRPPPPRRSPHHWSKPDVETGRQSSSTRENFSPESDTWNRAARRTLEGRMQNSGNHLRQIEVPSDPPRLTRDGQRIAARVIVIEADARSGRPVRAWALAPDQPLATGRGSSDRNLNLLQLDDSEIPSVLLVPRR